MKKTVILIFICCFLASCVAQSDNLKNQNGEEAMENKIRYEEGIYRDKNWDMIEFPIARDCIPDNETAIQIARNFLSIEKLQNETLNLSYNPVAVFYDTADNIWIVSFSPFQNGMLIPGDSYNIAMRKNTAEVLKMWVN